MQTWIAAFTAMTEEQSSSRGGHGDPGVRGTLIVSDCRAPRRVLATTKA
ncbi:MAG: hypothetical protein HKN37_07780 [Rhodothermales bacterium]|nr:hypothetical protein [Rhodothermales bacterium]